MSRSDRIDQDLVNEITRQYTGAKFWKSFSDLQLKELFTAEERADIKAMMDEVNAAAEDNERRAAAIARFSAVVAKILKIAKIVV